MRVGWASFSLLDYVGSETKRAGHTQRSVAREFSALCYPSLMLRRILFLFLFATTLQAQVPLGASKAEVVSILGWPSGGSKFGDREVMNYSDYSILLVDGKVASVEAKPNRKAKTKVPSLVAPRAQNPAPTGTSANAAPSTTAPVKAFPSPPVIRPATPPASVSQPHTVSSPRPSAADGLSVDAFAPLRRAIYVVGAFGLAAVGFIIWRITVLKKKRGNSRLDDITTWTSSPPPLLPEAATPLMRGLGAVSQPDLRRPDPIKDGWTLGLLKSVEWHRFEQLVAEYYRKQGFRANLTSFGADGGVDVEVFSETYDQPSVLVQCKAWTNGMVGVAPVRELYGVAAARKVPNTAFFATSGFYPDADSFARSVGMELIDGAKFIERIEQLPLSDQLSLHELATEGDYRTPTCAKCGTKMVLKRASKGRNESNEFYSCRSYPRCRNTINVPRAG